MSIIRVKSIKGLKDFANQSNQLVILERTAPLESSVFFKKLMGITFVVIGEVFKKTALSDIRGILDDVISRKIQNDKFYEIWLKDMAHACKTFCDIENSTYISIWIGTKRGCDRYHIDNVPQRMLVTYAGQGTEWLPNEFADRTAFKNGEPNKNIIKDNLAKKYISDWDMALFKGGEKGLLHRTPDTALNNPSILMRLDHANFWINVHKQLAVNRVERVKN
tara:strand:+ start:47 stop:709 length:663 start_codon:yes stop_codon:yes gene_type:complete